MHAQIRRPRTTSRPPGLHEREWRGRNVDKNLDDAWLESLNTLTSFDLISICEGHSAGRRNSEPHINLRIKAGRQFLVVANWSVLQTGIDQFLLEHSSDLHDTIVEAELRRRSRAAPGRGNDRHDDFVVKLCRALNTATVGAPMTEWFERMIPFVRKLDQVVAAHTQN